MPPCIALSVQGSDPRGDRASIAATEYSGAFTLPLPRGRPVKRLDQQRPLEVPVPPGSMFSLVRANGEFSRAIEAINISRYF